MNSPSPTGPRPGIAPACAFCGTPLSEAAWFKYEMELAAFQEQSPLIAPDIGNHNPIDRIPLTYCDECRDSVRDNAIERQKEEEWGDVWTPRIRNLYVYGVLAICFLIVLSVLLSLRR